MVVYIGVIHWNGILRDAIVETANTEGRIIRFIREHTRAEQRGSEFYDAEGRLVAFYVCRQVQDGGNDR